MLAEQTKARPASGRPGSHQTAALGAATYTPQAALPARAVPVPRQKEPRPPAARKAARRGRRSPMILAVLVGTFLVALLCCYVYAYARVTAAGFELSALRRDLRKAAQEEDALRAEVSRLSLSVEPRARAIGMVPAPPQAAKVLPAAEHEITPQGGE